MLGSSCLNWPCILGTPPSQSVPLKSGLAHSANLNLIDGGFFQVHATQADQRHAYLAESALYNPMFPVHKLPTTPKWVVPNAVCTDGETTLPLP
jgi:hypothetical protein